MSPNADMTVVDPEGMFNGNRGVDRVTTSNERYEERYGWMVFQSSLNMLAHFLIGMIVAANIMFAFRNGIPLSATPLHIVLCAIGYQLLMAEGILSLTNENGWSSKFRFVDKRRAHWIMQIVGSGLAIAGSFIKSLDKDINFNTLHGQFALVAMVFAVASLFNGLTSLWAYELRSLKICSMNMSKLTHICFGIVAFAAANISLCYGFDKRSFRNWATSAIADTFIGFTAVMTVILIFNPFITFCTRVQKICSN